MKRPHFALPEIYDDSLSYYDVLRKLIKSMHEIVDNLNKIPEQIANEAKERLLGDQGLQTNIDNEKQSREQADTALQQNINSEATTRERADQEIREGVYNKISELKSDLSNKLPKSPANWCPWTSEEQSLAREMLGVDKALGAWEDIVSITIEEGVSTITVDKDADGNPFSLSQIICEFIIPTEPDSKVRNVYLGLTPHPNNAFSRVSVQSNNTVKCGVIAYARVVSGVVICEASIGVNIPNYYQTGNNVSIFNGYGIISAESFSSISVFTYNDAFPTGSKLVIRGIRK